MLPFSLVLAGHGLLAAWDCKALTSVHVNSSVASRPSAPFSCCLGLVVAACARLPCHRVFKMDIDGNKTMCKSAASVITLGPHPR